MCCKDIFRVSFSLNCPLWKRQMMLIINHVKCSFFLCWVMMRLECREVHIEWSDKYGWIMDLATNYARFKIHQHLRYIIIIIWVHLHYAIINHVVYGCVKCVVSVFLYLKKKFTLVFNFRKSWIMKLYPYSKYYLIRKSQ